MGYFQVRYDSRVVNYELIGFIRLATASRGPLFMFMSSYYAAAVYPFM